MSDLLGIGKQPKKQVLMVIGGWNYEKEIETYDFEKQEWRKLGESPVVIDSSGIAQSNGKVYVVGGTIKGQPTSLVRMFDPVKNERCVLPSMNEPRSEYPAVDVLDGKIFAVGGWNEEFDWLNSGEFYDPAKKKWEMLPPFEKEKKYIRGCFLNGLLYAVGAESTESYDPKTQRWEEINHTSTKKTWTGVAALNGCLYLVGAGLSDSTAECFNPATNSWKVIREMNEKRYDPAVVAYDGHLYVIGGQDEKGHYLSSVEVYDPVKDSWTTLPNKMNHPRYRCGAVIIDDPYES